MDGGSTSDTLFGKIIRREIAADIVYENNEVVGFRDRHPQAPEHLLFVPRKAITSLDDATAEDASLLGKLLLACAAYARKEGLAESGYRVVINCKEHGGQTVYHLHVHLLAGRQMQWPPG